MPRITSWLEVEKRLANYNSTLKSAEDRLVKTNDSLNIMLNSLIINLKDLLESQSDISLWFYDEDEPTTSNQPYISWATPSDHYGDFFYSRTKGLVYQFTSSGWNKLDDATLLNALALTNAKLESGDHERKIFLDNPTTPYESGDWWIREDGTLYICQISRASGKREENDYIDALKYAQAVAKATDNLVEVLRGTMITTTDSAVVYEDKATHKTTTISGDSVRTGEIISNNYVPNSKGTKISLNDGTIDSKNFKVSSDGTISATNGSFSGEVKATSGNFGTLITTNGVFTTIVYNGENLGELVSSPSDIFLPLGLGYLTYVSPFSKDRYDRIFFNIQLPQNFTITSAKLYISHMPLHHYTYNGGSDIEFLCTGASQNIKVYTANTTNRRIYNHNTSSLGYRTKNGSDIMAETEIVNALGSNGFSGNTSSKTSAVSADLKNYLNNTIIVRSSVGYNSNWTERQFSEKTGSVQAQIIVTGYLKT